MNNIFQNQIASAGQALGNLGGLWVALVLVLVAYSPAAPAPVSAPVSSPAPAAPVTGTLQVNISGLPAGVAANVEVNGPESFSQTLAQTTTLSKLKSGTYSFTLNAVKPDSATFSDSGSPASLSFEASVGGSVNLNYGCSSVKPPDATLDRLFQLDTGKANYTCADLAAIRRFESSPSFAPIANLEGLQYATGLTHLDLSFNGLSTFPAGVFDNLTNLSILNLQNNPRNSRLSTLPAGLFDQLTNLTRLNLSGNIIETLPAGVFDRLTKLTHLNLSRNILVALPDSFANLAALEELSLSDNRLSALPSSLVGKLPTLKALAVHFNCLATQQNPVKAALDTFGRPLVRDEQPREGCPQKTINFSSLQARLLTDNRNAPNQTDTVLVRISIDGVAQGGFDFEIGERTLRPQETAAINKTLIVNSELKIEVFARGNPNKSIGEAVLPIDADYAPRINRFSLLGSGSVYVLTLNQH